MMQAFCVSFTLFKYSIVPKSIQAISDLGNVALSLYAHLILWNAS